MAFSFPIFLLSLTLSVFICVYPWFQKGFHDDAAEADDAQ